jgi:hypothetical protein
MYVYVRTCMHMYVWVINVVWLSIHTCSVHRVLHSFWPSLLAIPKHNGNKQGGLALAHAASTGFYTVLAIPTHNGYVHKTNTTKRWPCICAAAGADEAGPSTSAAAAGEEDLGDEGVL